LRKEKERIMNITAIDRSNYLKGLLIVAKKDNKLADAEKSVIKNFSEKLGFASDFCDEVIRNLLANKYIDESPIKFSSVQIAQSFITDGLRLAFTNNKIPDQELIWLKKTSALNGIDENWFENKKMNSTGSTHLQLVSDSALLSII
jgi:hypothetical protein